MADSPEPDAHAFFILDGMPKIPYDEDDTGVRPWLEIFPGLRIWWSEETYSDEELLNVCRHKEHYYSLRLMESISRRTCSGFVCELEVVPSETMRFLEENDELLKNCGYTFDTDITEPHQIVPIFTSFCLLISPWDQVSVVGGTNCAWRKIGDGHPGKSIAVDFEKEISLLVDYEVVQTEISIPVEEYEFIKPICWRSGLMVLSDTTNRYSDFLENYSAVYNSQNGFERIVKFWTCMESLLHPNPVDGISRTLRRQIPILVWKGDWWAEQEGGTIQTMEEKIEWISGLTKMCSELRNKIIHSQSLKQRHEKYLGELYENMPWLLYWLNAGLIEIGRIPQSHEIDQAHESGQLMGDPSFYADFPLKIIEDDFYRIDCTYDPDRIAQYSLIGGRETMEYFDFATMLNDFEESGTSQDYFMDFMSGWIEEKS